MAVVEQVVGSHLGVIRFYGTAVPVGFLASFRKKSHEACESGRGFVRKAIAGKRQDRLCDCAIVRAQRRLRQVDVKAFEALGSEWLEAERSLIRASEARCREEGRASLEGAPNPYPEGTDQALAWDEGASSRAAAGSLS